MGLCGTVRPVSLGCPRWYARCGVFLGLLALLQGLVWGGPSSLPAGDPVAVPVRSLVTVFVDVVCCCPWLGLVWVLAFLLLFVGDWCLSVLVS